MLLLSRQTVQEIPTNTTVFIHKFSEINTDPLSIYSLNLLSISLSLRLLCVLQPMCVCLSADSRLQTVSQCVSILTSMCDHETLARQLCSQHGKALPRL